MHVYVAGAGSPRSEMDFRLWIKIMITREHRRDRPQATVTSVMAATPERQMPYSSDSSGTAITTLA